MTYPIVKCGSHPNSRLPGMVVCPHVMEDPTVAMFLTLSTRKSLGEITCRECVDKDDIDGEVLLCAWCAGKMLQLPVPLPMSSDERLGEEDATGSPQ